MNPNVTGSASGYTCYQCGTWVPLGTTHECPTGYQGYHQFVSFGVPTNKDALERIAKSLERIADVLEKEGGG